MSGVVVSKVEYGGWPNCVRIENGLVELIVTTDVGPRILRYGFIGQANELCEVPATLGATGGSEWNIYGGHRLWHSPEHMPRSYEPDNSPIEWEAIENGIITRQPTEPWAQIRKEMEITLHPVDSKVRILHRLINKGPWTVELAAWALTVMATGGMQVVPQTRRDTGLLANRALTLWPYTKMNDHRVYWGDHYIALCQDAQCEAKFKFGTSNEDGWAAYFNHGHLFVKYFVHKLGAEYPDGGCSYETFTTDYMMEMESLSPLHKVAPGEKIEHLEKWELYDAVERPELDEAAIEKQLKGRVLR